MHQLINHFQTLYAQKYQSVTPDVASFQHRYQACSMDEQGYLACNGMCCYDGVTLRPGEAEMVHQLLQDEAEFFARYAIHADDAFIEADTFWGGEIKIATRAHQHPLETFPAHFRQTKCWFGDPETGACLLQVISIQRGWHPWRYKPLECWIHPISLGTADQPRIAIFNEQTDLFIRHGAGYTEYTNCGKPEVTGIPGYRLFATELYWLGQLLNRDLQAEVSMDAL
jgi:hypothetical protein